MELPFTCMEAVKRGYVRLGHASTLSPPHSTEHHEAMHPFPFRKALHDSQTDTAKRDSVVHIIEAYSAPPLARVRSGRFELTLDGELTRECWLAVPMAYPSLKLDAFTFYETAFRAILRDNSDQDVATAAVAWFMRISAEQIRTLRGAAIAELWRSSRVSALLSEQELFEERLRILLREDC